MIQMEKGRETSLYHSFKKTRVKRHKPFRWWRGKNKTKKENNNVYSILRSEVDLIPAPSDPNSEVNYEADG
jgi:hypothetical protein